jgi:5-methyltetrahydrofolate--homocysteine methyltransferase
MRSRLEDLLATNGVLLADGATGTNYFAMGLHSGEPPEFWNVDHPDRVQRLQQQFVDAGADVILTNTFGGNRHRLALHQARARVAELATAAARLAAAVAEQAARPVVVAGSVGPTGALFAPLGELTAADALETFTEQIHALAEGGADVAWIETMSAPEEMQAAARAAIAVGLPYVVTGSFDTAGRTMMGLSPRDLTAVFTGLDPQPVAVGANCGVGASDILVSLLAMSEADTDTAFVAKGNCGIPQFRGTEIHYSGTPELMARYVRLAVAAGARIVGGCCGTTPEHLAGMRASLDAVLEDRALDGPGRRPTIDTVIEVIGPLANAAPSSAGRPRSRRTPRRA